MLWDRRRIFVGRIGTAINLITEIPEDNTCGVWENVYEFEHSTYKCVTDK
jgi:hypothetical protein